MKISLLINIVGIFIFISRANFMLIRGEQEKKIIILGPGSM